MGFSVHFNQASVNQRYEEYKQAKALREQEQKQQTQQKTVFKPRFDHVKNTQNESICSCCKATIHAGEESFTQSRFQPKGLDARYLDNFRWVTRRFCVACKQKLCGEM